MPLLVGAIVVSLVAGLVLRRRTAALLPAILVPAFYLGLKQGWWGTGVGDGWQVVAIVLTVTTVGATAVLAKVGRSRRS